MQTRTTGGALLLEVPHVTRSTVHLRGCYLCISPRTRTVSAPDVPGSTQACPPLSCSRCARTRFRKQPGRLRRIKMRRKGGICAFSGRMIYANTNHPHRLESNNQAIGLRVALFGRKWPSIPARTANSCVRRYLLRWERDGSFRTEMCQVLRQERATQVPHSLARVALALLRCHPSVWKIGRCGFASGVLRRTGATFMYLLVSLDSVRSQSLVGRMRVSSNSAQCLKSWRKSTCQRVLLSLCHQSYNNQSESLHQITHLKSSQRTALLTPNIVVNSSTPTNCTDVILLLI